MSEETWEEEILRLCLRCAKQGRECKKHPDKRCDYCAKINKTCEVIPQPFRARALALKDERAGIASLREDGGEDAVADIYAKDEKEDRAQWTSAVEAHLKRLQREEPKDSAESLKVIATQLTSLVGLVEKFVGGGVGSVKPSVEAVPSARPTIKSTMPTRESPFKARATNEIGQPGTPTRSVRFKGPARSGLRPRPAQARRKGDDGDAPGGDKDGSTMAPVGGGSEEGSEFEVPPRKKARREEWAGVPKAAVVAAAVGAGSKKKKGKSSRVTRPSSSPLTDLDLPAVENLALAVKEAVVPVAASARGSSAPSA